MTPSWQGEVVEGDPDKVMRVFYLWVLCRDQTELDPKAAWRLLEVASQADEQFLWFQPIPSSFHHNMIGRYIWIGGLPAIEAGLCLWFHTDKNTPHSSWITPGRKTFGANWKKCIWWGYTRPHIVLFKTLVWSMRHIHSDFWWKNPVLLLSMH